MDKKKDYVKLSKAARDFSIGIRDIVKFLSTKGIDVEPSPATKISLDVYALLVEEFGDDDMPINEVVVDEEITSGFADREMKDPVISSIWDLITEMGKYRFDYADFEEKFNKKAKHIPHNLLKLILIYYAGDKTQFELASRLFFEMVTMGLLWEQDEISDFLEDKEAVFKNEIVLGRKVFEMLDRGEDPEEVLYAVKKLLTKEY